MRGATLKTPECEVILLHMAELNINLGDLFIYALHKRKQELLALQIQFPDDFQYQEELKHVVAQLLDAGE